MKRHIFTVGVTALLAVTTLSACGNDSDALVVGVSPTPHGDILEYISDNLAEDAGLTIEIQEFSDYVQPNPALTNGDIDANFFQHQPYLDEYNAAEGGDLVPVVEVLIEPLGAYSSTLDSIDQLPDNAQSPSRRTRPTVDVRWTSSPTTGSSPSTPISTPWPPRPTSSTTPRTWRSFHWRRHNYPGRSTTSTWPSSTETTRWRPTSLPRRTLSFWKAVRTTRSQCPGGPRSRPRQ